jgi:hypothetical protein
MSNLVLREPGDFWMPPVDEPETENVAVKLALYLYYLKTPPITASGGILNSADVPAFPANAAPVAAFAVR